MNSPTGSPMNSASAPSATSAPHAYEIRALLDEARGILQGGKVQALLPIRAQAEAEILLAHLVGRDRVYLHAHDTLEMSSYLLGRFYGYLRARASGYPLEYILGRVDFMGHSYHAREGVLIPRGDSEVLVEVASALLTSLGGIRVDGTYKALCPSHVYEAGCLARGATNEASPTRKDALNAKGALDMEGALALQGAQSMKGMKGALEAFPARIGLAEIGVGSGIIAIELASAFANLDILATDINPLAIELTRQNIIDVLGKEASEEASQSLRPAGQTKEAPLRPAGQTSSIALHLCDLLPSGLLCEDFLRGADKARGVEQTFLSTQESVEQDFDETQGIERKIDSTTKFSAQGIESKIHSTKAPTKPINQALDEPTKAKPPLALIVSNPPYVSTSYALPLDVAHEPSSALYSGKYGLDMIERLLALLPKYTTILACEIAPEQRVPIAAMVAQDFASYKLCFYEDLNGDVRALSLEVEPS